MGRRNYDLIIFDCDGTLVDSEYLNNKVSSELLIEFGLTEYTPEKCINEFAGFTWTNIKLLLEDRHNLTLPPDFIQTYIDRVHIEMESGLKPIPGAMDLVKASSSKGKICVASNGERSNVMKSLSLQGYNDYFSEENIFTRIQVPNGKPAPDIFLFAAQNMGVNPQDCLVIEDSPTGVLAGVAAGMDVFGFVGASHDSAVQEKRLKQAGTQAVFSDFIHIAQVLGY